MANVRLRARSWETSMGMARQERRLERAGASKKEASLAAHPNRRNAVQQTARRVLQGSRPSVHCTPAPPGTETHATTRPEAG